MIESHRVSMHTISIVAVSKKGTAIPRYAWTFVQRDDITNVLLLEVWGRSHGGYAKVFANMKHCMSYIGSRLFKIRLFQAKGHLALLPNGDGDDKTAWANELPHRLEQSNSCLKIIKQESDRDELQAWLEASITSANRKCAFDSASAIKEFLHYDPVMDNRKPDDCYNEIIVAQVKAEARFSLTYYAGDPVPLADGTSAIPAPQPQPQPEIDRIAIYQQAWGEWA